ncbi:MAG: bifunctional methylenetetrahydrofolate dehydrogenase/methenyltetrahydrofolate cyclohydrolase FolD [Proteobacteria bacterium]|nr:MAG: bifunctional methylenetetrahydrofolate dehydrogenase/methenyltetrahydrofolate cyclohydrolase FolD [Pseudomonadota bacterium]
METQVYKTPLLTKKLLDQYRKEAEAFQREHGRKPCLAVVLVGTDPASAIYVQKKEETCRATGLDALDVHLDPSVGFAKLKETVAELNEREDVDGILVQSPLPQGWDERLIQRMIHPAKDVDGFHPENAGRLFIDANECLANGLPPCTPAGVMEVLKEAGIDVAGKHAVIIGRSTIVGKPMAQMLLAADATVTIAHSRTPKLPQLCRTADILVAAVGRARFVTADFVKAGATVIDVGITREESADGKAHVVGDVHRQDMEGLAGFLTPVPGGIGPMTIVMLIRNTIRAARRLKSESPKI